MPTSDTIVRRLRGMPDSQPKSQIELLDFGSETPPARLSYAERVVHDGVGVSRCTLQPNPGTEIGATQFTVAIHEGTPFHLEWRLPEMHETERRRIVRSEERRVGKECVSRCRSRGWQDT